MDDKESLTMMTEPESHYNEKIEKNKARIKALLATINKLREENKRFRRRQKLLLTLHNR